MLLQKAFLCKDLYWIRFQSFSDVSYKGTYKDIFQDLLKTITQILNTVFVIGTQRCNDDLLQINILHLCIYIYLRYKTLFI